VNKRKSTYKKKFHLNSGFLKKKKKWMIYAAGLCSDLISFCNNISNTSFYLCHPMCIKLSYYCTSSVSNYKSLQLFKSQTIYIFDQNYRKDYNSERRVLIRVVDYIQTLIFLR